MMTAKQKRRGNIGEITVGAKCDYIVYGSVRGLVSEHRSVQAARASRQHDIDACQKHHGRSDASVYCWDDEDGWCPDYTDDDGELEKVYAYQTDSGTGQIEATDFALACRKFAAMFSPALLDDGAWGWIEDIDGYRYEVGVIP